MPTFENLLTGIDIKPSVLAMIDKELMEQRFIMPINFDEATGVLTIVTSNYQDVISDIALLTELISAKNDGNVTGLTVESVAYEKSRAAKPATVTE